MSRRAMSASKAAARDGGHAASRRRAGRHPVRLTRQAVTQKALAAALTVTCMLADSGSLEHVSQRDTSQRAPSFFAFIRPAAAAEAEASDTSDAAPSVTTSSHGTAVTNTPAASTASTSPAAKPSAAQSIKQTIDATIREPRAFGYTLGDIVTQRVLLSAHGHDIGAITAPSPGRIGLWLERRPTSIEAGSAERWLVIGYQVTNSPPTLQTITLPALTLASASGTVLRTPEWPISIGPLTPAAVSGTGDLQPLRPDRAPPQQPADRYERGLYVSLGLLAATLIAWAAWWRYSNWRDATRLPFARAWRQLKRMRAAEVDSNPDAWRALHRALNETAGQVVRGQALAALLARAPWLRELSAQLDTFYRQSDARFFGTGAGAGATAGAAMSTRPTTPRIATHPPQAPHAAQQPVSASQTKPETDARPHLTAQPPSPLSLLALCRALYRAERSRA